VGRRGRGRGLRGNNAQGRVRNRVRGGSKRGGSGGAGRKKGGFDAGAVEDLARNLTDRRGGSSGLTGAAAGLAGGGLAGKFFAGGPEGSDGDQLALIEERLQLLEDQVRELQEIIGSSEASVEPEGETDPNAP
jgi:hypothetical protein